jgi:hypothetical protein
MIARRLSVAGLFGLSLIAAGAGPAFADTALLDTMPPSGGATSSSMITSARTTYSAKTTVPTMSTTLTSITFATATAPSLSDLATLRITVRANDPVGFANELPGSLTNCTTGTGDVTCTGSITIPAGTTPWITWIGTFTATMAGKFDANTSPSTILSWTQGNSGALWCTAVSCNYQNVTTSPATTLLGYQGSRPVAGSEPVDILQQVGRTAGSTCDAPAVPMGAIGAALGGWAPSWAEWAVPVTGGLVCTRTLRALASGLIVS